MPPYGGVGYFFSWSACGPAVVLLWLRCTYSVVEGSRMAFLNKEQVERYASAAHLDLTGMTWQQKQKAINDHMKRNGIKDPMAMIGGGDVDGDKQAIVDDRDAEIAKLKAELAQARAEQPVPQVPVVFEKGKNVPQPTIDDYENVVLIASPEQRPTQYQKVKWYESVGTQKDTEEISFDVGNQSPFHGRESGTRNATYRVTDTGRKIEAESTMPKYSALITYRPTKDLVAIAEYGGRKGYLWKHHRLPNIRHLLDQMGVYDEFLPEWQKRNGRLFYMAGLECCDIQFTDYMIKKIQDELRKRER